MESYLHFTVTGTILIFFFFTKINFVKIFRFLVIRLDGSVPVKYGLRLNNDEKYGALKNALSSLCGIPPHLMKLAEVQNAVIKV